MKKILFSIIFALLICGCGTGGEDSEKANNEPTKIVVASCAPNDFLKKAAVEYSNTHDDHEIIIQEYRSLGDYVYLAEDRNRIIRDILSGENIDIIDLSGFEYNSPSYIDLIDNGYIEDQTSYFEESDKLSLDEFLDEVVALYDYNGYLGAVTNLFGLSCCLADKDTVPGSITVNDLIDYDLSNDNFNWPAGYNENAILRICLYNNLNSFVDLENATCDFDNDLFRKIMDYALCYAENSQATAINGKGSIRSFSIDKLTDVEIALQTQFEGNAIICGLPSMDGTFRTQMTSLNGCALAIASTSERKDVAWDFIEYCLSEYPITGPSENSIDTYGIPSKKKFLDRYLDVMAGEGGPLDTTYYIGNSDYTTEVTLHPLTEEGRRKIMHYIESAQPYDLRYQPVIDIISEEVGYYFTRQKNIDDIIEIIEKRVNLYLEERG